jgi:hypothetical protein
MSEFTKGPWSVLSDEHLKVNDPKLKQDCLKGFSGEDNILLFGDDCSALGAVYCGYGPKARVNAEADVALIASAPDMYEALKKFVDCWSDETGFSNPHYEDVELARKTLAKAKGE